MKNIVRLITAILILIGASVWVHGADQKRGEIPYDELEETDVTKVKAVVNHRSIFRRLKKIEFTGTSKVYEFLLTRLKFSADAVRALKIENYRVTVKEDGTLTADDGAGATGVFQLVYEKPGKRIYYAVGKYKGSLFRLKGRAVAVLEFEEAESKKRKMYNWVDLYFRIDNIVLSTVVRVISPIIGPLVDKKIGYFLGATQRICQRVTDDPKKVYDAVRNSKDVSKDDLAAFKDEFLSDRNP